MNIEKGCYPIDQTISRSAYKPIDLSVNNGDLNLFDTSLASEWERYISRFLAQDTSKVAYGGYLEVRNLYDRSSHFGSNPFDEDKRNIHLGVDFWCNVGTKVCSIYDGRIHSFQNNKNYGDYGPTIILEHQINDNRFYTLYGHLSLESLTNKKIGQKVEKEEVIATLGSSKVNGDYAPHLHFQVIVDIGNHFGDYPGVCSSKDLPAFKKNCPNPFLFIK